MNVQRVLSTHLEPQRIEGRPVEDFVHRCVASLANSTPNRDEKEEAAEANLQCPPRIGAHKALH